MSKAFFLPVLFVPPPDSKFADVEEKHLLS